MAKHGILGLKNPTVAKFDAKKFVETFSKGVPAHATQEQKVKTAIARATKLVSSVEGIQKETGFTRTQSINVLKGFSILGKQGVSRKTLETASATFGSKFLSKVEQLGSGKVSSISIPKETFFERKLPKPTAGKLDKAITSLFKKIF